LVAVVGSVAAVAVVGMVVAAAGMVVVEAVVVAGMGRVMVRAVAVVIPVVAAAREAARVMASRAGRSGRGLEAVRVGN